MTLHFQSSKSPDIIYDHLTDMQKFVSVHPVIFRIDPKGGNKYLVHEKLKLGFIPFSFTYPVTIDGDREKGLVTIKATVFKLTKITLDYKISSSGTITMIKEEVTFKTPLPVKGIMSRIFREQHGRMFENISSLKTS